MRASDFSTRRTFGARHVESVKHCRGGSSLQCRVCRVEAPLLAESGLLVGADPGSVERRHRQLDAVQPHLSEGVVDDDARRVGAVAAADVLAGERDAERGAPVLGPGAHSWMLPTSTGGSARASIAKPALSLSLAHHLAMRSFAAASDGGTIQFDSVAIRAGSIFQRARRGRSSSRTPRRRTRPPTSNRSPPLSSCDSCDQPAVLISQSADGTVPSASGLGEASPSPSKVHRLAC